MPRYYFDVKDGDSIANDAEGIEFRAFENAWNEAARTAAELAKDRFPGRLPYGDQQMKVGVRVESGPIMAICVKFSVEPCR